MTSKFSHTGIISGLPDRNTATTEKKQPTLPYSENSIRRLLQNVPVPLEFKKSLQTIIPVPQFQLPESIHSQIDGHALCEDYSKSESALHQESIDMPAAQNNKVQSFRLTDTRVNLNLLEHAATGLQCFEGRALSAIVTNTYFLGSCFYPPVYWCPKPDKEPCRGMYISYTKADEKTVNALIKIMADCGLPVKLAPGNQWCGKKRCCNNIKQGTFHRRVVLADRTKVPWKMSRIAAMIDGAIAPPNAKKGKSAFCIAINAKPAAIDWYEKSSPKEDTQFNPLRLPPKGGTEEYKGGSAATEPPGKTFQRTRCDLLAHVIAENFWGRNCYDTFKNYNYAHRLALIEENWIRRADGRDEMIWGLDPQGNEWKGLPGKASNAAGLQQMDEQLDKLCKTPATVTCSNNCPGGRCCADPVTPFGWQSCKDICNC
jgi:hypothetical protein